MTIITTHFIGIKQNQLVLFQNQVKIKVLTFIFNLLKPDCPEINMQNIFMLTDFYSTEEKIFSQR